MDTLGVSRVEILHARGDEDCYVLLGLLHGTALVQTTVHQALISTRVRPKAEGDRSAPLNG